MRRHHVLAFLIFTQTPAYARNEPPRAECAQSVSPTAAPITPETAKQTSDAIYADLVERGMTKRKAGGYAKLVATMVLSAAATAYLTSSIPNGLQFLSMFVSQLAAIGVYQFGAPILEPVQSHFRRKSFVVQRGEAHQADTEEVKRWEEQWWRTQRDLSLNAQMSQNRMTAFTVAVQQNFFEAYRAMTSENPDYAIEQIASAAYRMRRWYGDLAPDDPSLTEVMRAAFTNHFTITPDFIAKVRDALARKDASFADPAAQAYYAFQLGSWLKRDVPN